METRPREDPLHGTPVYVAENRAHRPNDFAQRGAARCPFCAGHEADTPPAICSYDDTGMSADRGNWQLRVVPNKYPAIGAISPTADANIRGRHEVFVESPKHVVSFSALVSEEAFLCLRAYRDRSSWIEHHTDLQYAHVFKNCRAAAGASIEHLHSQLLALPFVPPYVKQEVSASHVYHEQNGRCWFCDKIAEETAHQTRVVVETEHSIAFCPRAARFAYETWILPRDHKSNFAAADDALLRQVADMLRDVVHRLENVLEFPAYNFYIHTTPFNLPTPFDTAQRDHYHWHIEVFPRIVKAAGFEWGTGCFINSMPPEIAAQQMRNV